VLDTLADIAAVSRQVQGKPGSAMLALLCPRPDFECHWQSVLVRLTHGQVLNGDQLNRPGF
jgi:hypothetical protein